ncbi:MAG: transporter-associated protein EcsC [Clostridia bacterium]|jgi:hypothetical protein|nr:transporter-associated protein EcsC [Clostridia bacterium]
METYNQRAKRDLMKWKKKMCKNPSLVDKTAKGAQEKFNKILPEKYHQMMTEAIKHMTKAVLLGSKYTTKGPYKGQLFLAERDYFVKEKTKTYQRAAMIEGAGTGAGGLLLGLADFPLLLSIKIKFLYEIAAIYGFDTRDYKERLYILHIFQLAFSSKSKVKQVLSQMDHWNDYVESLPYDINAFDWRSFQQEYRDYIDLAKLLQLVPGIGAVVGAYVNTKLINKLSLTAMYAYHMRLL